MPPCCSRNLLRNSSESEALVGESDVSTGLEGVDVLKGTEFRGSMGEIFRLLSTSSFKPLALALFLAIGEKYAANPVGVVFSSFDLILFGVEYNSSMGRAAGCNNFESSRDTGANEFMGTGLRRVWSVQYMSLPLWNGLAALATGPA